MKHLSRILAVAVPIIAAAASTVVKTPAIVSFLANHPGDAAYVLIVGGALRAAWKAYTDRARASSVAAPPSGGSSMGAK